MFYDSTVLATGDQIHGNYGELCNQVDLNQALVSVKPNPFMPGGLIVQQVTCEADYDMALLHPKVKFYRVPRHCLATAKTVSLVGA